MILPRRWLPLGLLAAISCYGEYVPLTIEGSTTTSTTGTTTSGPTTSAPTTSEPTTLATIDGSGSSTAGSSTGTPDCQQLDVLVLIDRRPEMLDAGGSFLSAVAGNLQTILDGLETVCSVHVGMTSMSMVQGNLDPRCDELGSLFLRAEPIDSPMMNCVDVLAGRPYLTSETLSLTGLTCMVFTTADESMDATLVRPMDAAFAALSDELNGPGACNEGFFRPDAPLLVLVITDTDDIVSRGNPADWLISFNTRQGGTVLENFGLTLLVGLSDPSGRDECPTQRAGRLLDFASGIGEDKVIVADFCSMPEVNEAFTRLTEELIPTLLSSG